MNALAPRLLETAPAESLGLAPAIESVATAVPPYRIPQSEIKRRAAQVLEALDPSLLKYLSVFDNAGIEFRNFAKEPDWYVAPHGWADRNSEFLEIGLGLLEDAAGRALEAAGLGAKDVDGIVLVTSTGISTPSLDARLSNRMRLRPDLARVPVWGLGCAGGVAGLARAADLARAHPEKRFLLCSLELCSLAFLRGGLDKKMVVATTLFGDGAACAVVAGSQTDAEPGLRLVDAASHQWPDTEWIMGWDVLDEGLGVVFSSKIPEFVEANVGPVVRAFLARHGTERPQMLLHPGGVKVMRAYEAALGLGPHDLDVTASILRDHGNMSSPTVLFVLERALSKGLAPGERGLLGALGPGFSSELALVERTG